MELTVRPHHRNEYPVRGILIEGAAVESWLGALQGLGLSPADTGCYPLPGPKANSLWGCLMVPPEGKMPTDIGRNSFCQRVHPLLFIPEHSQLTPLLTPVELDNLVKDKMHFFHPSVGWVELPDPIRWEEILEWEPAEKEIKRPVEGIFRPSAIRNFQIVGLPPEEVLEKLDKQLFPEKRSSEKGPLSGWERVVLTVLRWLFSGPVPMVPAMGKAREARESKRNWMTKLEDKLTNLEERNKMELDKLLGMFRNDPDEALKYAIPIDNDGTTRGTGGNGRFNLARRWSGFSLFSPSAAGGGGVVLGGEQMQRLTEQYRQSAERLRKQGEYGKAAFVYLRLLKDHLLAAQVLEDGGLYAEAATVYLQHYKDKTKAAECYERGGMVQQAIDLYKELGKDEKVGDCYLSINRIEEANHYYEKVVNGYLDTGHYLKAALLVRQKTGNDPRARSLLLEGWRKGKDAVNCLNNYFSYFPEKEGLEKEMHRIYDSETDEDCGYRYLQVMKHAYSQGIAVETARTIAYEIIAARIEKDPSIAAELNTLNKGDRHITGDVLKYKHSRRNQT